MKVYVKCNALVQFKRKKPQGFEIQDGRTKAGTSEYKKNDGTVKSVLKSKMLKVRRHKELRWIRLAWTVLTSLALPASRARTRLLEALPTHNAEVMEKRQKE